MPMPAVLVLSLFAAAVLAAPSRLAPRRSNVARTLATRPPRHLAGGRSGGCLEDPQRMKSHVSGGHVSRSVYVSRPSAHVSAHVSADLAEKDVKEWTWRGNKITWKEAGPKNGPCVVLIHGFGVSSSQYRDNLPALAARGYRTFALDLLGLGSSEKPMVDYSTELWADQVADFIEQVVGQPSVIVGNSIGSLIGLAVAQPTKLQNYPFPLVNGLVLINCAIGMNSKIKEDDPSLPRWQFFILSSLFVFVDFVLKSPVAKPLFNSIRGQENIRNLLTNLYANPARVDDYLVQEVVTAANDAGAFEAFVKILTGDPGTRPEALMRRITVPTYVLWGDNDPVTPINGPVGKYFKGLSEDARSGKLTTFETLPGGGHCPHDDDPAIVNGKITSWLDALTTVKRNA